MAYIRGLPINDTPEMFGLHDNANITFALNETSSLLEGFLKLQPKSASGAGHSREEVREGGGSVYARLTACRKAVCFDHTCTVIVTFARPLSEIQ